MSLIDLIRGKPNTVAGIANVAVAGRKDREAITGTVAEIAKVAVAPLPSPPVTATEIVASIERIIINSSSATAIGAIQATEPADHPALPPALIDAATRVCVELHNDGPEAVAAMIDDLRHCPPDSWGWLTDHFTAQLPAEKARAIKTRKILWESLQAQEETGGNLVSTRHIESKLGPQHQPGFASATAAATGISKRAITCGNCQHSRPTQHPAILQCAAGVQSGLPIGGRWHSDRHNCPEFTDRTTGTVRRPVKTDLRPNQTETFNPDPFSFLET